MITKDPLEQLAMFSLEAEFTQPQLIHGKIMKNLLKINLKN